MLAAASAGTLIAVIMYGGSDKYPGRAQSFATALLTERAPDGTVRRYGWGGGLGTDFSCEPGRRLLAVLLSQRTYDATVGEIAGRFWRCVEAAALEP